MRHRKTGVKLNRTSSHRKAMFRNMVTSLFKHDRIKTTDTKAKALRGWADHMITLAKRGDLHARRQALAVIREKKVVKKLFDEAEERFGEIAGGYTRIVKLGRRAGDNAPISIIELVQSEKSIKKKAKLKKELDKKPDAGETSDVSKPEARVGTETSGEPVAEARQGDTVEPEAKSETTESEVKPETDEAGQKPEEKAEAEAAEEKTETVEEKKEKDTGGEAGKE